MSMGINKNKNNKGQSINLHLDCNFSLSILPYLTRLTYFNPGQLPIF
ncbi:hypothetical protein MTY_2418 [Moorella thermoacetica Y72]|uniref:Uncharacterized protein n=1 Tax=Moorella thermoacetica Y72 TaxID=1325331 RepID=A0A0S6UE57_NEOTH|nr:hypothetical protein MTY_2418 [Moorella thermoacetica Y72]